MDKHKLSNKILDLVGGKENISSITHCMTRLRFVIHDRSKVNDEEIKKIPEVIKVIEFGGQFQIVLGAIVEDVYHTIVKEGNLSEKIDTEESSEDASKTDKNTGQEKQGIIDRLIGTLSGIFVPLIPTMLGMSFLKVLCIILDLGFGVSETNSTYQILDTIADSFFYFLPMLVGWSAARRFNANIGISLMIIGFLIHPNLIELLSSEPTTTFLGIPINDVSYASSVLPAILSIYLLSKIEIVLKRIIPKALNSIMVPFFSLLIVAPVTILFLGPIGNWGGTFITSIFTSLYDFSPLLAGALIGGTWQVLIIGGMHIVILSLVTVPNIAALGRDTVIVTHAPGLICQYAAGLAVAAKAKDPKVKKTAATLTLTGFFGGSIVEPVMYGINLKYKKPFYFVLIGGAIGGAIAGASFAGVTAPVALSLYSLPAFFGAGFTGLMIGTLVGSLITFILTYIFVDENIEY